MKHLKLGPPFFCFKRPLLVYRTDRREFIGPDFLTFKKTNISENDGPVVEGEIETDADDSLTASLQLDKMPVQLRNVAPEHCQS